MLKNVLVIIAQKRIAAKTATIIGNGLITAKTLRWQNEPAGRLSLERLLAQTAEWRQLMKLGSTVSIFILTTVMSVDEGCMA